MTDEAKLKILIEAHNKANKAFEEVNSQVSKTEKRFEGMGAKLDKVAGKMKDVGSKMSTRLTLPILAGAGLAIKAFSDLDETINKVDVSFGQNADEVKKWSEGSITSMGLAQQSALDAAALFGDMGTGMGQTTDEASKMSRNLVQLGADLSSFKNIGIEQSQTALTAIYTGETESLKRLGIVMTQTNLEEYARKEGITKTIAEMSQAEKVQLRYGFVMDSTTNAQGDFMRTSDGIANQTRMTGERVKQLSADFGEKLAPAFIKLLDVGSKVLDWFTSLSDGQMKAILIVGGIVAAIGPLLMIIGNLITVIRGLSMAFAFLGANPVVLAVIAVILLIAGLAFLIIKNWDKIKTFFKGLWEGIQSGVTKAFDKISGAFSTALDFIKRNWKLLITIMLGPIGALVALVVTHWDTIKNTAIATFNVIKEVITTVFNVIKTIVIVSIAIMLLPILLFAKLVMIHWETIKTVAIAVFTAISNTVVTVFNFIAGVVVAVFNVIKIPILLYWKYIVFIFTTIKDFLAMVFGVIGGIASKVWEGIKAGASAVWGVIRNVFGGIKNTIVSVFTSAKNTVMNVWNSVKSFFSGFGSSISGGLSTVGSIISKPFTTAFDGIKNLWNSTVGKLSFKAPDWVPGIGGKGWSMPTLYKGARNFGGGPAVVGDINGRGGEIVSLPRGSDVFSNRESKNILRSLADGSAGGGSGMTFNNYGEIRNETAEASNAFWDRFNRMSELAQQGVPTNG